MGVQFIDDESVRCAFSSFMLFAAIVLSVSLGAFNWLSIPVALFIGTIGAVSVVKAVYIDKREIKCACVGGDSNVPLGFVSLTENVMMVVMALWMLFGAQTMSAMT